MEKKLKMSSPWVTYVNKLKALFGEDKDINIVFDEDENEVKLYVTGEEKADALSQIVPAIKVFGNVILKITIIPANLENEATETVIEKAFRGNPCFVKIRPTSMGLYDFNYVIFKNKVVQFYNDNLADINGNISTLYEDIARDVLVNVDKFFFCTAEE